MGMSELYGRSDEDEGVVTIHRALELGITFLDTADMYGVGGDEQLVGSARPARHRYAASESRRRVEIEAEARATERRSEGCRSDSLHGTYRARSGNGCLARAGRTCAVTHSGVVT